MKRNDWVLWGLGVSNVALWITVALLTWRVDDLQNFVFILQRSLDIILDALRGLSTL